MKKRDKSKASTFEAEENLLRMHRQHMGVYSRVAKRLGVDPSFVSRVANGTRKGEAVRAAVIEELSAIVRPRRGGARLE